MRLEDSVAIVTGGGNGLGAALCHRLHARGARAVVVADLDGDRAAEVAAEIGGRAVRADVASERDVADLVSSTQAEHGRVDVICSNAGIHLGGKGPFEPDASFSRMWQVHVMSIVYLARHAFPLMVNQGGGAFAVTASVGGLLTSPTDLSYAMTKHAQVAAAEWLAMAYGGRGVEVSCFCPGWMWTAMTEPIRQMADPPPYAQLAMAYAVTADEAADTLLDGIQDGRFMSVTRPNTFADLGRKAEDYDGWVREMQRWHDEIQPEIGALS